MSADTTCEVTQRALLDDAAERGSGVLDHLGGCAACRAFAQDARRVEATLNAELSAQEGLAVERLRAPSLPGRAGFSNRVSPVSLFAAATFGALVALLAMPAARLPSHPVATEVASGDVELSLAEEDGFLFVEDFDLEDSEVSSLSEPAEFEVTP